MDAPSVPPGVLYDVSHQCRLQYGAYSAFCDGMDVSGALRARPAHPAGLPVTHGGRPQAQGWALGGLSPTVGLWASSPLPELDSRR